MGESVKTSGWREEFPRNALSEHAHDGSKLRVNISQIECHKKKRYSTE